MAQPGRADDAMAALTRAVQAGYPLLSAEQDPDLRAVRGDPRFQQLRSQPGTRTP